MDRPTLDVVAVYFITSLLETFRLLLFRKFKKIAKRRVCWKTKPEVPVVDGQTAFSDVVLY